MKKRIIDIVDKLPKSREYTKPAPIKPNNIDFWIGLCLLVVILVAVILIKFVPPALKSKESELEEIEVVVIDDEEAIIQTFIITENITSYKPIEQTVYTRADRRKLQPWCILCSDKCFKEFIG